MTIKRKVQEQRGRLKKDICYDRSPRACVRVYVAKWNQDYTVPGIALDPVYSSAVATKKNITVNSNTAILTFCKYSPPAVRERTLICTEGDPRHKK